MVTPPTITQGIDRCVRLGARRVVVLPYVLFTGFVRRKIAEQVQVAQAHHPAVEMLMGEHLFPHPGLTEAVAQRYYDIVNGTAAMTCDLCRYRHPMKRFEQDSRTPHLIPLHSAASS
ncbi:MAG: hypothetical protein HC828_11220 [Blastochloris sp.]|nr:hypothetical protein [Blastochloris sp.]